MDIATAIKTISELISNVGVPVGLLIGCFWLLNKEREDHKAEAAAEREAHKQEIADLRDTFGKATSELTTAINNNTLVMQSIRDRISHE